MIGYVLYGIGCFVAGLCVGMVGGFLIEGANRDI